MNSTNLAKTAYDASTTTIRTARGTELEAFRRVTHRLKSTDPTQDFAGFCRALSDNRALWTLLAVDVADQRNALPKQLRAQIFYLAEFTDSHTSKVLNGQGDVDALVAVNTSVMRGLQPLIENR